MQRFPRLVLTLLCLAALAPTLQLGFIFDDHKIIEQNPHLCQTSWEAVKRDFLSNVFNDAQEDPYYRPLLTLSDRLDYVLWHGHPFGFHLTNLAYHIGSTWLLYQFILLLGFSTTVALLAASFFAVHPINIDLFLLVTARGEQMAVFFTLVVLVVLLSRGWKMGWLIVPAYGLALLSKESSVVVPMLLAMVYWYLKKPIVRYKDVFFLMLLTVPYLWLWHHVVGQAVPLSLPWVIRFLVQAFPRVLFQYAATIVFPWDLHFPRQLSRMTHAWPVFTLLYALLWGVFVKRKYRWALLCLGWFSIGFLFKIPAMMRSSMRMDHWAYLALPGLMIPVAIGLAAALGSKQRLIGWTARMVIVFLLVGGILFCQTHTAIRGSDEAAIRWSLKYEDLQSLRFKLGALLVNQGRGSEAIPYLSSAYEHFPQNTSYGNALALAYWQTGQQKKALALFEKLAMENPLDQQTSYNLREARQRLAPGL